MFKWTSFVIVFSPSRKSEKKKLRQKKSIHLISTQDAQAVDNNPKTSDAHDQDDTPLHTDKDNDGIKDNTAEEQNKFSLEAMLKEKDKEVKEKDKEVKEKEKDKKEKEIKKLTFQEIIRFLHCYQVLGTNVVKGGNRHHYMLA